MDPLSIARAAAGAINSRIRSAPAFDAVLPINDYSREVRVAVMNGATLVSLFPHLLHYYTDESKADDIDFQRGIETTTTTSITQKGRFVALGEQTPSGGKLHLLVEGTSFAGVERAMRMLCERLPGGGMAVVGGVDRDRVPLLESSGPIFRLILPGIRCSECKVEFWTMEDGRSHFARGHGDV